MIIQTVKFFSLKSNPLRELLLPYWHIILFIAKSDCWNSLQISKKKHFLRDTMFEINIKINQSNTSTSAYFETASIRCIVIFHSKFYQSKFANMPLLTLFGIKSLPLGHHHLLLERFCHKIGLRSLEGNDIYIPRWAMTICYQLCLKK